MSDVTVAEETNAQPAAVEKRAEDTDLDTLLSQFEEGTKKETVPPPEPPKPPTLDPADIAAVREFRQHRQREDVDNVCKDVFDGLEVPIRGQRGWLVQLAAEDPRIEKAFINRANDPGSWKKVVKYLKQEAQKEYQPSKVDPEATADHYAVSQAVRGASTKIAAEPAPDFSKMTDAELNKWKQENMK